MKAAKPHYPTCPSRAFLGDHDFIAFGINAKRDYSYTNPKWIADSIGATRQAQLSA
jgi:hypothetical protein